MTKKNGGTSAVAQMVECLPDMHETGFNLQDM